MKLFLQKFKKLGIVNNILLISILGIFFLAIFSSNIFKSRDSSEILEISKDFKLNVRSYNFENNIKDRFLSDMALFIVLEDSLSQEDFNSLKFEIKPVQGITPELISDQVIKISFKEKSPGDEKINEIIITRNGKQVYRIIYKNLNTGEGFDNTPFPADYK